jgi:hypothetical protein
LNRAKVVEKLKQLGWVRDEHGWIIPQGRTVEQQDNNWAQAILEAIECPHEQVTP